MLTLYPTACTIHRRPKVYLHALFNPPRSSTFQRSTWSTPFARLLLPRVPWATSTASQERSPLRFFCPHQRRRHRVSLETVPELDLIRLTHFRHFWNAAESRFLEQRSNDSFPSVRALIKIVIYVPTGSKLDRVHHNHRAGRSNSSGSWLPSRRNLLNLIDTFWNPAAHLRGESRAGLMANQIRLNSVGSTGGASRNYKVRFFCVVLF